MNSKKNIALQHIDERKSYGYLSKTYGIPNGTIATWVRTFNLGNKNMSDNRGRPKYVLIKEIFEESKRTYGYRRVCEGLLVKYGVTFNADSLNKVWTTDITYLIYNNKRLYLSTILDLYDRKVVAYKISKFNNIPLVVDTLNEAIAKRKDVKGTIIHSDQGFQYTSYEYKAICESNGIQISMSRKGTPIDDSPMESFHGILKKETLYNNNIKSIEEYQVIVEDWIEFYNTKRLKNRKKSKISS